MITRAAPATTVAARIGSSRRPHTQREGSSIPVSRTPLVEDGAPLTGDGCRRTQGPWSHTCAPSRTARHVLFPQLMKEPVPLPPLVRTYGGETWEEKRERLDADWQPLYDEKHRKVHGWAHIEEIPAHMLGRELRDGSCGLTLASKAFGVKLIATRDGLGFGALPRTTWHGTRDEALSYARKALAQQGKRYAKKYGGAS